VRTALKGIATSQSSVGTRMVALHGGESRRSGCRWRSGGLDIFIPLLQPYDRYPPTYSLPPAGSSDVGVVVLRWEADTLARPGNRRFVETRIRSLASWEFIDIDDCIVKIILLGR
jgi:hypothetical protein